MTNECPDVMITIEKWTGISCDTQKKILVAIIVIIILAFLLKFGLPLIRGSRERVIRLG